MQRMSVTDFPDWDDGDEAYFLALKKSFDGVKDGFEEDSKPSALALEKLKEVYPELIPKGTKKEDINKPKNISKKGSIGKLPFIQI